MIRTTSFLVGLIFIGTFGALAIAEPTSNAQPEQPPVLQDIAPMTWTLMSNSAPCHEAFPDLPALTVRLGIQPLSPASARPSVVLKMCNGDKYSLFNIINVVLDRIEKR